MDKKTRDYFEQAASDIADGLNDMLTTVDRSFPAGYLDSLSLEDAQKALIERAKELGFIEHGPTVH